jgi:GNAT superfamily N-acetyltransferase
MLCDICGSEAWYVCGQSGRPVCAKHARIEIVSRLSFGSSDTLAVREATPADREEIRKLTAHFKTGSGHCLLGGEYNVAELPAYVVASNNHIAGLLSYALEDDALSVASFGVLPGYQGLGAGKMLVEAAKLKAAAEGKTTINVGVSNDDLPAIYFYQRNGFRIWDVKLDAILASHGEVRVGFGGITAQDQILLRWRSSG